MRKPLIKTILLGAAAVLAVSAQTPEARRGTPPDPAVMIEQRVNFLGTVLSLTDAQKSQAISIFTSAHTSAASLHSSLAQARDSIREAVKTNQIAAIDQAAATIGTLSGQLIANQSKAEATFYALLTPEQRTKYDELGSRRVLIGPGPGGMGPGMGPGPGGGMGPGGRMGPRFRSPNRPTN